MPPRKPVERPFLERFGGITTWLVGIAVGGLVNMGIMYQQFDEVKKNQKEGKDEQKALAAKLAEFREKQIAGLADVERLKAGFQNLDSRVLVIERIFIEKPQQQAQARAQR